jgi:hypothetical protein
MQTLAAEIATTFADDAIALVTGSVRIALHIVMAPIERIANACDVEGTLRRRRPVRREPNSSGRRPIEPYRPFNIRRLCRWLSPFRNLRDLT